MIFTKDQLLTWIRRNSKDRLLQDALGRGKVIIYGGFNPLPGGKVAGWIIKIGEQYICVTATKPPRWYRTKTIPWQDYVGKGSANPLVAGEVLHPQSDWCNAVRLED